MSWIPVEERLPEASETNYLVTRSNGIVNAASRTEDGGFCFIMTGGRIEDAVAWMPYPEPYVKPRRFVVEEYREATIGLSTVHRVTDTKTRTCPSYRIPTREAADKIADIYEEAYR